MCGRFALGCALDALLPHLQGPMPPGLAEHYAPRSLIRPGEPVLLQRQEHGAMESALVLWGLLPEWRKDPLEGPKAVQCPRGNGDGEGQLSRALAAPARAAAS